MNSAAFQLSAQPHPEFSILNTGGPSHMLDFQTPLIRRLRITFPPERCTTATFMDSFIPDPQSGTPSVGALRYKTPGSEDSIVLDHGPLSLALRPYFADTCARLMQDIGRHTEKCELGIPPFYLKTHSVQDAPTLPPRAERRYYLARHKSKKDNPKFGFVRFCDRKTRRSFSINTLKAKTLGIQLYVGWQSPQGSLSQSVELTPDLGLHTRWYGAFLFGHESAARTWGLSGADPLDLGVALANEVRQSRQYPTNLFTGLELKTSRGFQPIPTDRGRFKRPKIKIEPNHQVEMRSTGLFPNLFSFKAYLNENDHEVVGVYVRGIPGLQICPLTPGLLDSLWAPARQLFPGS